MQKINFKIVTILTSILLSIIFCPTAVGQQGRIPFCGFSLKEGGYYGENVTMDYINRKMEYIVKQSTVGDETGIATVVEKIKKVVGITNVKFTTYIAEGDDNCFASVTTSGERILVIDVMFLVTVNKQSTTQWAAISIIAHEIGHHIAGFNRRATSHEAEFDADYWSGYILQKLGSSEEAATKCMMRYGTDFDTKTHPNKNSRISAIKKGWRDASNGYIDKDRCDYYVR